MFTVAITGGIGSGKSTVADRFAALGVPIIDADVIARQVVEPGSPALGEIEAAFGGEVIGRDGTLDRAALRSMVFSNTGYRRQLEAIVHPRIHARIIELTGEIDAPYAIVVIPLLAESTREYPLDRVLVVDASSEKQLQRVASRDKQSRDEVEQIIAAQAKRSERLAIADDVFLNDGTIEDLNDWVDAMHRRYLELSAEAKHDN